jgi:hypothetical protein
VVDLVELDLIQFLQQCPHQELLPRVGEPVETILVDPQRLIVEVAARLVARLDLEEMEPLTEEEEELVDQDMEPLVEVV